MERKTWEQNVTEITAMAQEHGVEWHELRNEVGTRECESGNWPEDEGMGSSDMNCLTVGMWESEPDLLRSVAQDLRDRKRLMNALVHALGQGVTLEEARRVFDAV